MSRSIVSMIPSGINEIDQLWSGLYRGGTYLVYGRTTDGRSVLPLMFAAEGCRRNDKCLFIATDRPRSLVIHASLIDFDIKEANRNNLLKLVRFPSLSESRGISDDVRSETLKQLVELVRKNTPARLVLNDLAPFVQFESFDRFRREIAMLLDSLDELNVTSIIALPEPANVHSKRVVNFLKSQVVGTIHVDRKAAESTREFKLSLFPNIGHLTKEYQIDWGLPGLVGTKTTDARSKQDGSDSVDVAPSKAGDKTADVPAFDSPEIHDVVPVDRREPKSEEKEGETESENVNSGFDQTETSEDDSSYGENLISELNKELIGLVEPFEVVSSEPGKGPVKPEVHTDRGTFSDAADFYFDNYQREQEEFLLIGIRLEKTAHIVPRKFDFEFVAEVTRQLLNSYDLLLIDSERQLLVTLIASPDQTSAEVFFRKLREQLLEEAPNQAEHLMQSVSAIVASNGDGFRSTNDFLTYIGGSGSDANG